MAAPIAIPKSTAMTQIAGLSRPRYAGRICTCVTPMIVETKPMIEPTERSIWRMTMMSTMPVAMMAIDDVWTLKFHRLRGVRNRPSPV